MTPATCPSCGCLLEADYAAGHRPGCPDSCPPLVRAVELLDRIGARLRRIEHLLRQYAARRAASR